MTDIVERIIAWQEQQETYDPEPWDLLCHAADEIERLRTALERINVAMHLQQIAREALKVD